MTEINDGEPTADDHADVRLLAELRTAIDTLDPVPERLIEAGKAAFSWRTIDAELAMLEFDSLVGERLAIRSAADPGVRFTFESASTAIDVEVTDDLLIGQVVPSPDSVELETRAGTTHTADCDANGQFTVAHPGRGPVRIVVRTADGNVSTEWVTLP